MTQTLTTSLFERLGGHAAIQHVVAEFCNRLLADENLAGFFAWTNMDLLARSQVQFLTTALGGPGDYHGRSLKDAHARRDITTRHFNLFARHLVESLKAAGVRNDDVEEVMALVGSFDADIVTA